MSSTPPPPHPHVVLLTSSGMSHLAPFLRLAASLVHYNCQVTLITSHPIVSLAESKLISSFLSAFPQVSETKLHLLPFDSTNANSDDPFWLHFEAIRRSLHLLPPLLSSLYPPLSAMVSDVSLVSPVIKVTANLNVPTYLLFISSATMFSLFIYYSTVLSKISPDLAQFSDVIEIPGIPPIRKSSVPPLLRVPNSLFASMFKEDGEKVVNFNGILINTFEILESDTLDALNSGKVMDGLPPVLNIGLMPCEFERGEWDAPLKWLDNQLAGSVLYICFGSRTAMSREQIREIGKGLLRSGCPFMWVVRDKVVDKEDKGSLSEVLGDELIEKIQKAKGLVVKEWVDQAEILGHRGIGGFFSHSGWSSVVEAAWNGVRLLAWPLNGDQGINGEVVQRSGLGVWPKDWGFAGEVVVKGEEIGEGIKEMMGSEWLRLRAAEIKEVARKAVSAGGSCENSVKELVEKWRNGGKI